MEIRLSTSPTPQLLIQTKQMLPAHRQPTMKEKCQKTEQQQQKTDRKKENTLGDHS